MPHSAEPNVAIIDELRKFGFVDGKNLVVVVVMDQVKTIPTARKTPTNSRLGNTGSGVH
jgi:hypothetical protein